MRPDRKPKLYALEFSIRHAGTFLRQPSLIAEPSHIPLASVPAIARITVAFGYVQLERTNIPSSPCQTAQDHCPRTRETLQSALSRANPTRVTPDFFASFRSARPSLEDWITHSVGPVPIDTLLTSKKWWRRTGLNRRPPACKAGALPLSYAPVNSMRCPEKMVGPGRLELPTSRLSSARSNQLSYEPNARLFSRIAKEGMRRRRQVRDRTDPKIDNVSRIL